MNTIPLNSDFPNKHFVVKIRKYIITQKSIYTALTFVSDVNILSTELY